MPKRSLMTTVLPGSRIEIVGDVPRPVAIRAALLDFDGTLSLVRGGWQTIMLDLMVEALSDAAPGEPQDALRAEANGYVVDLTGEPTLVQMQALAEAVARRGASAESPEAYKELYLERLEHTIQGRLDALAAGTLSREDLMVPGATSLLAELAHRGIACCLASGTDHDQVVAEADILDIAGYFDAGVYGAVAPPATFSKAHVIAELQQRYALAGPDLLVVGDGPVEIIEGERAGAITVGVASDEDYPGRLDADKRARLIEAGAALIVPDLTEQRQLWDYLERPML
jgi:phosphoglycolate phosphatase